MRFVAAAKKETQPTEVVRQFSTEMCADTASRVADSRMNNRPPAEVLPGVDTGVAKKISRARCAGPLATAHLSSRTTVRHPAFVMIDESGAARRAQ